MKLNLRLLAISVGLTSLVSCGQVKMPYTVGGQDNFERPNSERLAVNQNNLSSPFQSRCFTDTSPLPLFGNGFRELISFTGSQTFRILTAYNDANCTSELYRITLTSDSVLSGTTLTESIRQMSVFPTQQAAVNVFNERAYCRRSSWQVQVTQIVTDSTLCDQARIRGYTVEIYSNGQLFLVGTNQTTVYQKQ